MSLLGTISGICVDRGREAIEHLMSEGMLFSTIDDLVSFRCHVC